MKKIYIVNKLFSLKFYMFVGFHKFYNVFYGYFNSCEI